ncbi:hybrid sensor histidine kinase/response regulator [Desulfobacterales bacterium HSG17]|nr:hybrid sensor histidine kinase/response regulator [Desulfobacterales bacterium HSG17]
MKDIESHILIVDDNPQNLQILGQFLKQNNYNVAAAVDGKPALEMIASRKPDLVLLDIMMPIMDGIETCRQIKANPETNDIPVIFLTAKVETDDIVKGFEIGAADYVTKPFNTYELLARIKTHLELKKSRDIITKQSREQKELLHILCHDLANPFNSIISLASVFNSFNTPEKMEEMMHYLKQSADNGVQIIDLVRKMRALDEKSLEITGCDLKTALSESMYMLKSRFSEKNISCEIFINENEDYIIYAEKTSLINSIINNLLTNAIKFSYPDSKIFIRVQKENDKVILSIKDFGIGMPKKILNDIFDIRKSTSRTGTNGETGTGFGMPLVKKFIQAYGGEIDIISLEKHVESLDNNGTEIIITLKVYKEQRLD